MPVLGLFINTPGPTYGNCSAFIDDNQSPGTEVEANINQQWAFIYISNATAPGVAHWLSAKEGPDPGNGGKKEILGPRDIYADLDSIKASLNSQQNITLYAPLNSNTSVVMPIQQLDGHGSNR